jgi:hypothetical protein
MFPSLCRASQLPISVRAIALRFFRDWEARIGGSKARVRYREVKTIKLCQYQRANMRSLAGVLQGSSTNAWRQMPCFMTLFATTTHCNVFEGGPGHPAP